jgi:pheromone shutdown-related protein TraB
LDHESTPETAFSENVTVLRDGERTIYLVGTAHVSRRSVDEVREVIRAVRPDTVCVELDAVRHDTLMNEDAWRKLDIFRIIRQKKVLFLLVNLALGAFQRRIGEKLGVQPGAELRAAVEEAHDLGAELVLADRDIRATLRRTWASLSLWNKAKLLATLLVATTEAEEITEEQLEAMKGRDTLSELMEEFARELPRVKGPLIDERDAYLMSSIDEAPGRTIVAVVGAGHVAGMIRHRGREVDREALSVMPPPGRVALAARWILPAIVLAAFAYGIHKHQGEELRQMFFAWILPNSVLCATFTLLAGAKLLSVVTAFFVSPITSLNPTLGAGFVVGPLEAWLRKPTVDDCQRIRAGRPSAPGSAGPG